MHPNLTKALFLSYLLMVALSCKAAPGELNDTTTSPPCDGLGGTAECLIAYQQPELELKASSNGYNIYKNLGSGVARLQQRETLQGLPSTAKPKTNLWHV
ncbi:hypothetical protein BT93_I0881 [Corymbia citriodora subsp. variegata]|nr:hypothetical protein BT93_I0881 [Corymbia citriodora subsp. variegata]